MVKKLVAAVLIFSIMPTISLAKEAEAEAYCVINAKTRQIIYEKNENKRLGMASTTKIMTALVALENKNPSDIVTVSKNAQDQEGSSIYLRVGDKISLEDLLYGLMLNSGNDAAVAIAEAVSGNVSDFVVLMNEKAEEIGCKSTNFVNPNGLSDENHYSTAHDMALIMAYAVENDAFCEIASTKEHQIAGENTTTFLKNHNKLLWQMRDFVLGKTGYTKKDGRCLVSYAKRDGVGLVCVTLNDKNDWEDHRNFYETGFGRVEQREILSKNQILSTKTISGEKLNILAGEDVVLPLVSGQRCKISCKIFLDDTDGAIYPGMQIGTGKIFIKDREVATVSLISGQLIKTFGTNNEKNIFFKMLQNTLLSKSRNQM